MTVESAAQWFFALVALGLLGGLAIGARRPSPVALARLDRGLLASFSLFLFVAWAFEPYVVYLCGWEGLPTAECRSTLTGRLWHFYASEFDPIFLDLPLWLRIVCSLDTLLFGPFYAISVYAFATNQQAAAWYRACALPCSGALLYSTIVYFAYELLAEGHRARLGWVFVINLPWTLAPLLLRHHAQLRRARAAARPSLVLGRTVARRPLNDL